MFESLRYLTLPATLGTAGALGLIYIALTARVIRGRFSFRVSLGDGGKSEMQRRIRAHGNFGEYVPLALLLMALIEMSGPHTRVLAWIGAALVVGRVMHAIGIEIPRAPNPWRFVGGLITYLWIVAGSIWALAAALGKT